MSVILLPGRWLSQPQQPVELDLGSSLLRDATVVALPAAGWRNMLTGEAGSVQGEYGFEHGLRGFRATGFGATTSGRVPIVRRAFSARSMLFVHAMSSVSTYADLFRGVLPSGTGTSNERWEYAAGPQNRWVIHGAGWNTSTEVGWWAVPALNFDGRRVTLMRWSRFEDGGFASAFFDGRLVTRTSGTAHSNVSDLTQSTGPAAIHFGAGGGYPSDHVVGLFVHWGRYVTEPEVVALAENPWQIFRPIQRRIWIGVSGAPVQLQRSRPAADITAGPWTPSTGASLSAMLSEPTPSDATYISTDSPGAAEVRLSAVPIPELKTHHKLSYRIKGSGMEMVVRLKQGATTIASWSHSNLPGSEQTFTQALSEVQAAAITNGADLRVEVEAI